MKPGDFQEHTPTPDLVLPIHTTTTFVLVRAHYPENVGAAARAIKTMGFLKLALVKPGRLAQPDHEMAQKMAVKSKDVLGAAPVLESLAQAVAGIDWVVGTTSRRGVSGVLTARELGQKAVLAAARGETLAIVFGNEKTGLGEAERALARDFVRIPMAADQPSINLAQATQIIAYELLISAFEAKGRSIG
ncbi:MAG: RNA methyltransferase [Myxococcales bacterium]|nr:RNA methyltransferase [Myxococcales bacterium]